ncbi:hypothetical protein JP33_05730 [Gallibacterium anatis CCM5995]|nr:hypothetical protein JP33_05730 [Gallibacterium anatis CCM5995]
MYIFLWIILIVLINGRKNDLQKINYYQRDCFSFNRLWGGGSNNIDRSNVEPIIPNHPQDQTNNLSTSTDTTQKDKLKKLKLNLKY